MLPQLTERVVYARNLLESVSCQLSFPAILIIGADPPAAYQEKIRDSLPLYQQNTEFKLNVNPGGAIPDLNQLITSHAQVPGTINHIFESEDRVWSLKLSRDKLTLACKKYTRWEDFESRLRLVLMPFVERYKPAFFQHTCVRYKNALQRSLLNLPLTTPWSFFVRPAVSGPLGNEDVASDTLSAQYRFHIRLPNGDGTVESSCGLGTNNQTKEPVFLIESHVYDDKKKGMPDALRRISILHRWAGSFFRWCITDELHDLLQPTTAPDAVPSEPVAQG